MMFSPRQEKKINLVEITKEKGLYYFQKALEGKSGSIVEVEGQQFKMISSYDYLGLIGNKDIEEAAKAAIDRYGTGSGGVRLLSGTNTLHIQLEKALADFTGLESVITYTSGYTANLAIISSLFGTKDVVIVDSKIHQSTVDACKLAGVPYRRFEHNNLDSLEKILKLYTRRDKVLIITEGIFSMDGDIADLPGLVSLKEKYGALLMVDEAHSLGAMGKNGRGIASHFGISPRRIDIITASLSKAVPANGGMVAGSQDLITLLQHNSTPFVFSAAMGPSSVAAVLESIKIMEEDNWRVEKLWENTRYFRAEMKQMKYKLGDGHTPVIPVQIGKLQQTLEFAGKLYKNGIIATPVVFPAVAVDEGILRICITAVHTKDYLDEVLAVFRKLS